MKRILRRAALALAVAGVIAAAWFVSSGGRYLQHEDPLQKADVIFVLAGTRAERILEGVDLYKEGWAPVIMLSPGRPDAGEQWLHAHGIRFPLDVELQRDALIQLGVPADAILARPGFLDNTGEEAELLRDTARARGWRRVIVVTSKYHTRRSGVAFHRALDGSGVTVVMRATRYDPSDPARWWRTRADFRYAIVEWQKLLGYWAGS